jgi:hypothetical protein
MWNNNNILKLGSIRIDLRLGPITSVNVTLRGVENQENSLVPLPLPPELTNQPKQGIKDIYLPLIPGPKIPQSSSAGKLIGEVAKIYTEEQKYDGTNGSFDHKLAIFHDICQRVDLPQEALMRAFPTMLKGLAQDHFYNNQLSQRTYEEACTNIRSFFEGPGFQRRNLDKWNATTLISMTAKHPEKSIFEVVQLLINDLRQLQYGLTPALRSTEFLHNKIVTSCQGSPACRYAVSDPPADLGQLINKLQSSITTYEKEQQIDTETFFTDRRYYSRDQPSHRPFGGRRYDVGRNRGNRKDYSNDYKPDPNAPKSCFICKRPNCRSWKHTPEE